MIAAVGAYLDIYRAHFKAYVAQQLQYRAALVIWLIGMVLEPVIYLVVWSAVASSSGGQVGGYSAGDFAGYYIVLLIVNHLTFTWIMHDFEYRVRQGEFSPKLLRPLHPIHGDVADNLTYKLLTIVALLPAVCGLVGAFRPTMHLTPTAAAAFMPALVLAFIVRFLLEWTLALAAFWTTRVNAVNQMYFAALLFFSGRLAPLSLLPAPVQTVAAVLPFRWMISFPVEVLLGRLTPPDTLAGYAIQALWIAISLGALGLMWHQALRRYTAVGA